MTAGRNLLREVATERITIPAAMTPQSVDFPMAPSRIPNFLSMGTPFLRIFAGANTLQGNLSVVSLLNLSAVSFPPSYRDDGYSFQNILTPLRKQVELRS
jgi:hypothetical protein